MLHGWERFDKVEQAAHRSMPIAPVNLVCRAAIGVPTFVESRVPMTEPIVVTTPTVVRQSASVMTNLRHSLDLPGCRARQAWCPISPVSYEHHVLPLPARSTPQDAFRVAVVGRSKE